MNGYVVDGRVDRSALAKAIADAALLRGEFVLRSGKTSQYYLDKYKFSTRPELLDPVARLLAERVGAIEAAAGVRTDRLAGAELGGIPLVTATSLVLGRPTVFVRNAKKDYGTAQQLEGAYEAGETVVLLEDVATTAGQALEAAKALGDVGLKVLGVIATIDREEGARANVEGAGLRFEALFTKGDLGIAG
ncbi:MAG: orotate phosphoribosyltransferase [Planctomycetota bacterium]